MSIHVRRPFSRFTCHLTPFNSTIFTNLSLGYQVMTSLGYAICHMHSTWNSQPILGSNPCPLCMCSKCHSLCQLDHTSSYFFLLVIATSSHASVHLLIMSFIKFSNIIPMTLYIHVHIFSHYLHSSNCIHFTHTYMLHAQNAILDIIGGSMTSVNTTHL